MSAAEYARRYEIKWADVDPNGHVRHSVYGDYAVDVRVRFLLDHDFPPARFRELGFGPVLLADQSRYLKEVVLGDAITVSMKLAGLAPDGSRWKIQHDVIKVSGEKAATLRVEGAWLDLATRKLIVPPPDLVQLFGQLPRTADYEDLPSLKKLT